VARDLVGCTLVRFVSGVPVSGRIVETEAYGDETDLASHAAVYRRSRSEIMRAEPGTVYVYRSYGIHFCFNLVAHLHGGAGAVLIRAAEPLQGKVLMAHRRGISVEGPIANGPGRLAQAFALTIADTGYDVVAGNDIQLFSSEVATSVEASPRIGITRDVERCWRYYDPGSNALSRRLPLFNRSHSGPC
jgi:DNA-3-methyladenine glycosylase